MPKNNKITTLERSLTRFLTAEKLDMLHDKDRFDAFCEPFFTRAPVLKIIQEYLNSRQYSPRILALLVYSHPGNSYLHTLIEGGLDPHLIYQKMMFEGAFWKNIDPEFVLGKAIASDDERWAFDARKLFPIIEPMTCLPGLIEAMVARVRNAGKLDSLLISATDTLLHRLITEVPEALKPELASLTHIRQEEGGNWVERAILEIKKAHLNQQTLFENLIGHRCA